MKQVKKFLFLLVLTFAIFICKLQIPISAAFVPNETMNKIVMVIGERQTLNLSLSFFSGINIYQNIGYHLSNSNVVSSVSYQYHSKYSIDVSVIAQSPGVCILGPDITYEQAGINGYVSYNCYEIQVVSPNFTVSFEANGGICPIGSQPVSWGQPYGSLPTPSKAGYIFDGWFNSEGNLITNTTTFNQKSNIILYAHWTPSKYYVHFDANGGETPIEYKQVTYGEKYGILPVPICEGYKFKNWYTKKEYGIPVTAETIVSDADEHVLYAIWEKIPDYGIVVREMEGGTVTVNTQNAKEGESIIFHASALDGYLLKNVAVRTESGKTVEATKADGSYSFIMPDEKVEITGIFEKIPDYQITVRETAGGTVTVNTQNAREGETIVFHASALDGYLLKNVAVHTESGKTVEATEASGSYSFIMPDEKVEITGIFEKISDYQITVREMIGGRVTVNTQNAKEGEIIVFYVSVLDGYLLKDVAVRTESGEAVNTISTNGSYGFAMPAQNVTITAVFQKNQQSVNPDNLQKEEEESKKQERQKLLLEQKKFQAYKASLKKVEAQKKKAVVSWKKVKDAEGYVIEYAIKSNFKGKKKINIKNGITGKKTVKKLKSGKRYFVRIRAYRTIGGKKIYTKYSTKKKVIVK